MKCMIKKEKRYHTRGRKQALGEKNKWGRWRGWERSFWEREKSVFVERNEKKKIAQKLYIEKRSSLDRELLRIYRALILDRFSCRSAIESYQWQRKLDGSNSYRGAIEQIESFLMDRESIETNSRKLRWIEIALTSVEKGRSKILMDS